MNQHKSQLAELFDSLLYCICMFLDFASLKRLSLTNVRLHRFADNVMPDWRARVISKAAIVINSYLVDTGCDFIIRHVIDNMMALVAGGFVAMHLHDDLYTTSDIDVFIPYHYQKQLHFYLSELRKKHKHRIFTYSEDKWEYENIDTTGSHYIRKIYNFVVKNQKGCENQYPNLIKIQFIVVGNSDVKSYIRERFDLSWCQVYFDMEKIHIIGNPDWQLAKRGIINRLGYNTLARIDKYTKRGYKLIENNK